MIDVGTPEGPPGRLRVPRVLTAGAGLLLVLAVTVSMGVQAARGNRTVGVQLGERTVHDTALDNAFYHCIDVQVRSLVRPGHPVVLQGGLYDLVTLLQASGSWITVAGRTSTSDVHVTLVDGVPGPGTCRGTVARIAYRAPDGGVTVRTGRGASLPGSGPPPASPL